ncbi:hypothetical protein [uncultured Methanobrevibacter sp.]|nr:hypothetical protein [uncultured Methanobrevibacter sp.]
MFCIGLPSLSFREIIKFLLTLYVAVTLFAVNLLAILLTTTAVSIVEAM